VTGRRAPLFVAAARFESVLAALLIAAVVMNVVNVVSRYVFGESILGADEIQVYLMIAMAFLGAAVASVRHAHLRMDVLTRSFRPATRSALERIEALLTAGVCGLVTVVATQYTLRIYSLASRSENAHIPMWIPHSLVAIGFASMTLVAVVRIFGRGTGLGRRNEGEDAS
jgi:C4-dicarboxylate transporter, DctQ subunit